MICTRKHSREELRENIVDTHEARKGANVCSLGIGNPSYISLVRLGLTGVKYAKRDGRYEGAVQGRRARRFQLGHGYFDINGPYFVLAGICWKAWRGVELMKPCHIGRDVPLKGRSEAP